MRTNSFSSSEKINKVNNDFKLCFHADIHIYIKYYTLINGDKHWNYTVITQKLNQNYMNFRQFAVDAQLITFPVACYVLTTAKSAISAQ